MTTVRKLKVTTSILAIALMALAVIAIRQRTGLEAARPKVARFEMHCRWTQLYLQTIQLHLARPSLQRSAADMLRTRLQHEPNDFVMCTRSLPRADFVHRCELDDFTCYANIAAEIEAAVADGVE